MHGWEGEEYYPKEATILVVPHMDPGLRRLSCPGSQKKICHYYISQIEESQGQDLSENQQQHSLVKEPASFQTRK